MKRYSDVNPVYLYGTNVVGLSLLNIENRKIRALSDSQSFSRSSVYVSHASRTYLIINV